MSEVRNMERQLAMHVVEHVRSLIERGVLKPGDKLAPERELARELDISRASLRAGIGYLAAMGVLRVRHGVGAFIAERPTEFGSASLPFLDALHGFEDWQLFEARRLLESQLAALAAERGTEQHFSLLAEHMAEMFATLDNPVEYLIHDVRFHRAIADAAGNPILAGLMNPIIGALYDRRRESVQQTSNLRDSANQHREIFRAIRSRDAALATSTMELHLRKAENAQQKEKPIKRRSAKANGAVKAAI